MNQVVKNKVLTWLVVVLVVVNTASIAMFWLGKATQTEQPNRQPKDFLVKELKLDAAQQAQLEILAKEHQKAVSEFREEIKEAKQNFFNLLKQQNPPDSIKQNAAAAISRITEKIDLLTLAHFKKVRALCTARQQKKFDEIIQQLIDRMGEQRRTGGPDKPPKDDNNNNPPPRDDQHSDRPPPER